MYQGCNKTALCSQNTIAESFYDLLKEKEYSKITVSEICKKSGVSRQTFYSLFSSKENIVAFILSKEYAFNPEKECNCCGTPTLSELSKGFSSFIVQKGDFIELLEKNNITYLLQETLFCGFKHYTDSEVSNDDAGEIPRDLALDFIASGLTTIAKHYVKNRNAITCERLEGIIYSLFSGAF
ncbi:MAG: TetR/AcrR family transcriptional regulator [Butyrivibrio sp.]|nr:TetR/AcrR family transcriptional regulator [Butyrivibrio sp.]